MNLWSICVFTLSSKSILDSETWNLLERICKFPLLILLLEFDILIFIFYWEAFRWCLRKIGLIIWAAAEVSSLSISPSSFSLSECSAVLSFVVLFMWAFPVNTDYMDWLLFISMDIFVGISLLILIGPLMEPFEARYRRPGGLLSFLLSSRCLNS